MHRCTFKFFNFLAIFKISLVPLVLVLKASFKESLNRTDAPMWNITFTSFIICCISADVIPKSGRLISPSITESLRLNPGTSCFNLEKTWKLSEGSNYNMVPVAIGIVCRFDVATPEIDYTRGE